MTDITADLQTTVVELRQLLAASATNEVAGRVYLSRIRSTHQPRSLLPDAPRLHSPARQHAFLFGLLLTTEEPVKPVGLAPARWERCVELLNHASETYARLFMPDQPGEQSQEWWHAREVAGPAFLQYFNNGLIASVEQLCDRVQAYCVPFDAELRQAMGLSASEALAIMDFIVADLKHSLDTLLELTPLRDGEQKRFFATGDFRRRSDPDFSEFFQTHYPILHQYMRALTRQGEVPWAEVEAAFPAQAAAFRTQYTIGRGEGPALHYPTESSVFDVKPLLVLPSGRLACPSTNTLFEAVLRSCEATLAAGPDRRRFFKHRDKVLEQEGAQQLRRLTGPVAQLFSSVFETPKAHFEHDLVVVAGKTVLVVEAKASPPIEPSRLPERAFERLRQSFRKDTGIQKGFAGGRPAPAPAGRRRRSAALLTHGRAARHARPAVSP